MWYGGAEAELCSEELHHLHSSTNIITMNKSMEDRMCEACGTDGRYQKCI
jgi:hypothetical protein